MEIFWNIPTQGDGHFLGTSIGARALTPGYMQQIAQATDQLAITACWCRRVASVKTPGSWRLSLPRAPGS